jgi:hypothetical protein
MWFIWFKFIREKLPRNIPFNLSLLSGILLTIICLTFLTKIYGLLFPGKDIKLSVFQYFSVKIENMFTLLVYELANVPYLYRFFDKNILYFIKRLLEHYYLLTLFDFIFRTLLVNVFIYDVISYKIIWLLLFIYIIKFLKFSLNILKNDRILHVSEQTDVHFEPFTAYIPLNDFIHIQTTHFIKNNSFLEYDTHMQFEQCVKMHEKHNLKPRECINMKILRKSHRGIITFILQINRMLYLNQELYSRCKIINIINYSLYLICWSYILIISLPTLTISPMELAYIKGFHDFMEPFSQLKL